MKKVFNFSEARSSITNSEVAYWGTEEAENPKNGEIN